MHLACQVWIERLVTCYPMEHQKSQYLNSKMGFDQTCGRARTLSGTRVGKHLLNPESCRIISYQGLSLPTNRPLPSRNAMALVVFRARLSSVFRLARYLAISNRREAGRLSYTRWASGCWANASKNWGGAPTSRSSGSYCAVNSTTSPILLGEFLSMVVLMSSRHAPAYLTNVCL